MRVSNKVTESAWCQPASTAANDMRTHLDAIENVALRMRNASVEKREEVERGCGGDAGSDGQANQPGHGYSDTTGFLFPLYGSSDTFVATASLRCKLMLNSSCDFIWAAITLAGVRTLRVLSTFFVFSSVRDDALCVFSPFRMQLYTLTLGAVLRYLVKLAWEKRRHRGIQKVCMLSMLLFEASRFDGLTRRWCRIREYQLSLIDVLHSFPQAFLVFLICNGVGRTLFFVSWIFDPPKIRDEITHEMVDECNPTLIQDEFAWVNLFRYVCSPACRQSRRAGAHALTLATWEQAGTMNGV